MSSPSSSDEGLCPHCDTEIVLTSEDVVLSPIQCPACLEDFTKEEFDEHNEYTLCSHCSHKIKRGAKKCKHCKSEIDYDGKEHMGGGTKEDRSSSGTVQGSEAPTKKSFFSGYSWKWAICLFLIVFPAGYYFGIIGGALTGLLVGLLIHFVKNNWLFGFLVVVLSLGLLSLVFLGSLYSEWLFREEYMDSCVGVETSSYDYCNCTYDYLIEHYGYDKLVDISNEYLDSGNPPKEMESAVDYCLKYLEQ